MENVIKTLIEIFLDIVIGKLENNFIKKSKRKNLIITDVKEVNYIELRNKKVLYFENKKGKIIDFNKKLSVDDKNLGIRTLNFASEYLAFKINLLNNTNENVLLSFNSTKEMIEMIEINQEYKLYILVNRDTLKNNNNNFVLKIEYNFGNKKKNYKVYKNIIYEKHNFINDSDDWYTIKE